MVACVRADPDDADARLLIAELDDALAAICGDSGSRSFDANDVRGPRSVFLLARDAAGKAAGCGALRPIEGGVAEIKQMYARPATGAGRHLLAALEKCAREFGYEEVRLETRRVNLPATVFYERNGYRLIPNYGQYIGRDNAICLGKDL